jgi:hypothetical protein
MIDGKIKWGNCRIKKNKVQDKSVDLQTRAHITFVQFQILNEKYKDTLVIAENEISTNLYFLWKIS